jgi:hypothetical protein
MQKLYSLFINIKSVSLISRHVMNVCGEMKALLHEFLISVLVQRTCRFICPPAMKHAPLYPLNERLDSPRGGQVALEKSVASAGYRIQVSH